MEETTTIRTAFEAGQTYTSNREEQADLRISSVENGDVTVENTATDYDDSWTVPAETAKLNLESRGYTLAGPNFDHEHFADHISGKTNEELVRLYGQMTHENKTMREQRKLDYAIAYGERMDVLMNEMDERGMVDLDD